MIRHGLALAGGLLLLGAPAWATDYSQATYSAHPISGYAELYGGWGNYSGAGVGSSYYYDESANVPTYGGAGRVAIGLSPNMSFQADAWSAVFNGDGSGHDTYTSHYTFNYTFTFPGIGGHLTWRTMNGNLFGVLASVGAMSGTHQDGTFGTIGVEGVHNYGNWRFYGQAGLTGAFTGAAGHDKVRDWYAHGVVSYFFTPNFVLSGNFGYDSQSDKSYGGSTTSSPNWGARLEYKPDSMPLSLFVAYWGMNYTGSDHSPMSWHGSHNAIVGGVRILFDNNGKTTLHDIADSVGLTDMNHIYGDLLMP